MIGSIVGMLAYGIRWTVEMLNEVKYDISDKYIFFNFSILPFFCFFFHFPSLLVLFIYGFIIF